jgi:hypothetical protein
MRLRGAGGGSSLNLGGGCACGGPFSHAQPNANKLDRFFRQRKKNERGKLKSFPRFPKDAAKVLEKAEGLRFLPLLRPFFGLILYSNSAGTSKNTACFVWGRGERERQIKRLFRESSSYSN